MTSIKDILAGANKQYKRQVGYIGANKLPTDRLPTGIFQFDLATGGGFVVGRVNLVYGPESSMKSTLCLKAVASAQKKWPNKVAVFVDIEGHFDNTWAKRMGVDCERLAYVAPTSSEEMIDVVEQLMYAEDVSVIVIDSLAAMVTTAELESSSEKAVVGNASLAVNKFYRKSTRALLVMEGRGTPVTLLLVNQTRSKIGVMYGDPETMPGGVAFKFASYLTVRVYGKDEFDKTLSDDLPAYKKVSVIVKKWKQPIASRNSEMMIALMNIPAFGLKIGDSYDWNTVLGYLKSLGMLAKSKEGWDFVDTGSGEIVCNFKTQDEMKARMYVDPEFAELVKNAIIVAVLDGDNLIPPEDP